MEIARVLLMNEKPDTPAAASATDLSAHSVRIAVISAVTLEREGLKLVLESAGFAVVAVADLSMIEPQFAESGAPQLFIVDVPAEDEPARWFESLSGLRQRFPSSRIVLLSNRLTAEWWSICHRTDLDGYLSKACQAAVFERQLNLVLAGARIFPFEIVRDSVAARAATTPRTGPQFAMTLSSADRHMLGYLLAGYGNKAIAAQLQVSEATVKARMKSVCQRLGVANRTQAAIWALRHGIQSADDRS